MRQHKDALRRLLDAKLKLYDDPRFIAGDPVSIPHQYVKLQDIEITAFWAAVLAWGQRATIVKKANALFALMDNAPYDFVCGHSEKDLKRFADFRHRTFNDTDTLYFIHFFRTYYAHHDSLELAFTGENALPDQSAEHMLTHFHEVFFGLEDVPQRTRKHVPTPLRKSTCKRINMFLRWMVRRDAAGVDFGIWKRISPAQLVIPLDLHVDRVARRLGLITRKQTDWQTVLELTEKLRAFDPEDPVKYDYALFGMGIMEKMA